MRLTFFMQLFLLCVAGGWFVQAATFTVNLEEAALSRYDSR